MIVELGWLIIKRWKDSWGASFAKLVVDFIRGMGFKILIVMELDSILAAFLHIVYNQSKGVREIISYLLIIGTFLTYMGLVIYMHIYSLKQRALKMKNKSSKTPKSAEKKEIEMEIKEKIKKIKPEMKLEEKMKIDKLEISEKTGLKLDIGGLGMFINELQMVRDFFIPFFIVVCYEVPFLQILLIFMVFLIESVVLIYYRPFNEPLENLVNSANGIIYMMILATFMIIHIFRDTFSEGFRENVIGYFLIVLLIINIAIALTVAVALGCKGLY